MTYFKIFFSTFFFLIVICSFKAWAGLPLPMATEATETREFLAIGDSIMLVGFLLWIAYIVFFFPKDSLKKL